MASKPPFIHSKTSILGPSELTAPRALLQEPQLLPPPGRDVKPATQTRRARTHTWPLQKTEQDLIEPPILPPPAGASAQNSPSKASAPPTGKLQPPHQRLQVMLDRLDRDLADCPYYEVHEIGTWR